MFPAQRLKDVAGGDAVQFRLLALTTTETSTNKCSLEYPSCATSTYARTPKVFARMMKLNGLEQSSTGPKMSKDIPSLNTEKTGSHRLTSSSIAASTAHHLSTTELTSSRELVESSTMVSGQLLPTRTQKDSQTSTGSWAILSKVAWKPVIESLEILVIFSILIIDQ